MSKDILSLYTDQIMGEILRVQCREAEKQLCAIQYQKEDARQICREYFQVLRKKNPRLVAEDRGYEDFGGGELEMIYCLINELSEKGKHFPKDDFDQAYKDVCDEQIWVDQIREGNWYTYKFYMDYRNGARNECPKFTVCK